MPIEVKIDSRSSLSVKPKESEPVGLSVDELYELGFEYRESTDDYADIEIDLFRMVRAEISEDDEPFGLPSYSSRRGLIGNTSGHITLDFAAFTNTNDEYPFGNPEENVRLSTQLESLARQGASLYAISSFELCTGAEWINFEFPRTLYDASHVLNKLATTASRHIDQYTGVNFAEHATEIKTYFEIRNKTQRDFLTRSRIRDVCATNAEEAVDAAAETFNEGINGFVCSDESINAYHSIRNKLGLDKRDQALMQEIKAIAKEFDGKVVYHEQGDEVHYRYAGVDNTMLAMTKGLQAAFGKLVQPEPKGYKN